MLVEAVSSQVMIHNSLTFTQREAVDASCLLVGKCMFKEDASFALSLKGTYTCSFLFEMLPEVRSIRR